MPGIWLSASLSILPKRSISLVRRLLLISMVVSYLIFCWLTARLGQSCLGIVLLSTLTRELAFVGRHTGI